MSLHYLPDAVGNNSDLALAVNINRLSTSVKRDNAYRISCPEAVIINKQGKLNQSVMKQKIYILGIVSSMIMVTGSMFKVNHWPAAGILLTIGAFLLVFLFLPAGSFQSLQGSRECSKQASVHCHMGYLPRDIQCVCILKLCTGHMPGHILMIAIPFPFVVFLPVWLYVTSKIKNFDINNTIFILFLLAMQAVFSALLSLNVTRERINASLEFSGNLYSLNHTIETLPAIPDKSALSLAADDVIKNIDECRQLLFNRTGISRENLMSGTSNDRYYDSRNIALQLLLNTGSPSPAGKLEESVRKFADELGKVPGYQDIAKQTMNLLELDEVSGEDTSWGELMFADNYLSWVIVDLDAMENIVRVIKMSVLN